MVWLISASSPSCSAQNTNDDDLPEYEYACENLCEQGSFCGRDLQCHVYSCENWYRLGHPTMTGHVIGQSPDLSCKIVENDVEDRSFLSAQPYCYDGLPTAVTFVEGCDPVSDCWDGSSYMARLNRKCTSIPSDGLGFVCYDMDPGTETDAYFAAYVAATANLDSEPCAEYNETVAENHVYSVQLSSTRIIVAASFASSSFNATLAMKTLVECERDCVSVLRRRLSVHGVLWARCHLP